MTCLVFWIDFQNVFLCQLSKIYPTTLQARVFFSILIGQRIGRGPHFAGNSLRDIILLCVSMKAACSAFTFRNWLIHSLSTLENVYVFRISLVRSQIFHFNNSKKNAIRVLIYNSVNWFFPTRHFLRIIWHDTQWHIRVQ